MKKMFAALMTVAVLGGGLVSTAAAIDLEVSGDVYGGVFDKYLWRGFDLSGSEPVFQFGADLSAAGFTLSYWSNLQISDDDAEGFESGEITETDITLDYTFNVHDLVAVSVGNIFYQLEGLNDTNELYLGVGVDTLLAPTLTVYWDYDEAKEDGYYVTASVGHTFQMMDALGVNLGLAVSYNGASDFAIGNYHDWHNYEAGISADYTIVDNLTVSPSFLYSSALSDDAKLAIDSEILAGVNLTLAF